MADQPRLERGQNGDWVTYLQQTLSYRNSDPGQVDGQFGDVLEGAVKRFQRAHNLAPDGVVAEQTWNALLQDAQPAGTADPETDERLLRFDLNDYPLLAEVAQYGEGEDAFRRLLTARGVADTVVEALLAAS